MSAPAKHLVRKLCENLITVNYRFCWKTADFRYTDYRSSQTHVGIFAYPFWQLHAPWKLTWFCMSIDNFAYWIEKLAPGCIVVHYLKLAVILGRVVNRLLFIHRKTHVYCKSKSTDRTCIWFAILFTSKCQHHTCLCKTGLSNGYR